MDGEYSVYGDLAKRTSFSSVAVHGGVTVHDLNNEFGSIRFKSTDAHSIRFYCVMLKSLYCHMYMLALHLNSPTVMAIIVVLFINSAYTKCYHWYVL